MKMLLDGDKYDWLLNLQTLVKASVHRFKSLAPSSGISIVWRAASSGAAYRRRQLSAVQMMEMLLDGDKYDWLLILQTLL